MKPCTCPLCNGPGMFLGVLGFEDCYRCLYCGASFQSDHELQPEELNAEFDFA